MALSRRHRNAEERQDYRAALITWIIAEVNRNPKKRQKAFKPEDFMPRRRRIKRKLTGNEMLNRVKAITTALGGDVVEKTDE